MALVELNCVTVNAMNPAALARFWAALVGGTPHSAGNGFVLVEPENGIRLLFQQADGPGREPGWIHLDCTVADRTVAEEAICKLGGRMVERRSDSTGEWVVMADPEVNPFCI